MNKLFRTLRTLAFCVAGTLIIAVIGAVILTAAFGEEWEETEDEI